MKKKLLILVAVVIASLGIVGAGLSKSVSAASTYNAVELESKCKSWGGGWISSSKRCIVYWTEDRCNSVGGTVAAGGQSGQTKRCVIVPSSGSSSSGSTSGGQSSPAESYNTGATSEQIQTMNSGGSGGGGSGGSGGTADQQIATGGTETQEAMNSNEDNTGGKSCGGVNTSIIECSDNDNEGGGIFAILLIVLNVLTFGVGIAGTLGIVIAGVMYLTARDNEAQIVKAKTMLINIVIGLAAYAVMWAFLQWLLPGGIIK